MRLRAVGAHFDHGAVAVSDAQNPRAQADGLALELRRVAAAIQVFVVAAHGAQPQRIGHAGLLQQPGAVLGVLAHLGVHVARQSTGVLVQLRLRRDLPQVARQRSAHQRVPLCRL